MSVFAKQRELFIGVVVALLLVSGVLTYMVVVRNDVGVYAENALLENLQVLAILAANSVFLVLLLRKQKVGAGREDKLFLGFLALLCVGFFLREIDVERFDLPAVIILLGSGIGRNLLLLVGFCVLTAIGVLNVKYYFQLFLSFVKTAPFFLLCVSAVCLYVGGKFEDADFMHHVFVEELIEFIGYGFLLLASVRFIDCKISLNE